MDEQTTTIAQTNGYNAPIEQNNKRGRQLGSSNLHSKHPSSIAMRLKLVGVDWVASFAIAIKRNDKQLLTIWLRLLPYLIVTQGHKRVKRSKGRASKAAMRALEELEGR
jgi:hypothetical protein